MIMPVIDVSGLSKPVKYVSLCDLVLPHSQYICTNHPFPRIPHVDLFLGISGKQAGSIPHCKASCYCICDYLLSQRGIYFHCSNSHLCLHCSLCNTTEISAVSNFCAIHILKTFLHQAPSFAFY